MWLCLSLLVVNLQAQSRKELEDKRRRIVRDIEKTDKLLKQNTQNIEASTVRFERLQSQIESRAALIDNIEAEIVASEEIINRNTVVVAALADDVDKMKKAYSRVLRTSFRRKTLSNPMLFVLSAESLNQAFLRWVFLLKYDRYRKKQAEAIRFTQSMLFRRIEEVKQTRIEKENLLIFLQGQRYTLERELSDKDGILKSLENKQSSLKRDLMEKQKAQERLDVAIENIIREEVSKRVDATKAGRVTPTVENPKKSVRCLSNQKGTAALAGGARLYLTRVWYSASPHLEKY
jgi:septal ring factor EnvC (AmiA/AmiB activator)